MSKAGDGPELIIRSYDGKDMEKIQQLNKQEGWTSLTKRDGQTKEAWKNSNIAYVAESENQELIGYIRGSTDGYISTYICELLIAQPYRGYGLGRRLLDFVHELHPDTRIDLLASSSSSSFYEENGFRPFYGFRKSSPK
ncbi:MAG: GNAT family N-acetyltransferase [Bacillota bacterium]